MNPGPSDDRSNLHLIGAEARGAESVPVVSVSAAPAAPKSRESTFIVRDRLKSQILIGALEPGSELSQAGVAKECGISRGPVREAFRLLEREGLIEAEVNQRARVKGLSVDDLEHIYAMRVVNESLALSVSVPRFSPNELQQLEELAADVADPRTAGFEVWEEKHQRFHMSLLAHSGERMLQSAAVWSEHSLRYRRVYVSEENGPWTQGAGEHVLLAQLCRDRDAAGAARLLALHLSRAVLTLLSSMAPTHEPALLRAAIRQAAGNPNRA